MTHRPDLDLAHNAPPDPPAGHTLPPFRLTIRREEAAAAIGISVRLLDQLRAGGRFPLPDAWAGRIPLWRAETVREWIANGGAA